MMIGHAMQSNEWKPGLPPGEMTAENKQWFLDTYEVCFSPGGMKWHRKRVDEGAASEPVD